MGTSERTSSRDLEQMLVEEKPSIQHETLLKASYDLLYSLIERALTDAEQMVASIKMKAQTEAEDEAVRIIDEAKQGADEIKRRAEVVAQKEAEDVLSALSRKDEITEVEAKQKAQLYLLKAREEIEKEVREEYKQAHSRLLRSLLGESGEAAPPLETLAPTQIDIEPDIASKEKEAKLTAKEESKRKAEKTKKAKAAERQTEEAKKAKKAQKQAEKEAKLAAKESALKEEAEETVQLKKEATISESVEEITQELPAQQLPKEKPSKRESIPASLELDRQALYDGEVELAVSVPVDPVGVSKLYNHLQMTPEIKILYTRGSWDRGTTITLTLDRPLPLIDIISKIPDIEITPVIPQNNSSGKGTSSSLLRGDKKDLSRIDISLK